MAEPIPIPRQSSLTEEVSISSLLSILQRIKPGIQQPVDINLIRSDPSKIIDRIEIRTRAKGGILEFSPEGKEKASRAFVFVDSEGKPYKKMVWLILAQDRSARLFTEPIGAPIFEADSQRVIDFANEVFDISEIHEDDWLSTERENERDDVLLLRAEKNVGERRFHVETSNFGTAVLTIEEIKPQEQNFVVKNKLF